MTKTSKPLSIVELRLLSSIVKKDLAEIPKLKGSARMKALKKSESDIRLIGSMIETQALHQDGLKNMDDFRKKFENGFSYIMDSKLRDEIFCIIDDINIELDEIKAKYPPESFNVKILSQEENAKYHILEEMGIESQRILAMPNGAKIGRRFSLFLDSLTIIRPLSEKYNWIKNEAYYIRLREIYLVILPQIRSFGGENLIVKVHSITPKKKKSELLAINKIQYLQYFPSDWIEASNNHNPLFMLRSYKQEMFQKEGPQKDISMDIAYSHKCSAYSYDFRNYTYTIRPRHSTIHLYKEGLGESALVHELGHRFVYLFPIIGDLEETLFLRRTTTKSGRRRKVLETGSDFREGDFQEPHTGMDPYLVRNRVIREWHEENPGKELKEDWPKKKCRLGYEVFSTGIEQVLSGDRGRHDPNQRDDEFRHFILGILAVV